MDEEDKNENDLVNSMSIQEQFWYSIKESTSKMGVKCFKKIMTETGDSYITLITENVLTNAINQVSNLKPPSDILFGRLTTIISQAVISQPLAMCDVISYCVPFLEYCHNQWMTDFFVGICQEAPQLEPIQKSLISAGFTTALIDILENIKYQTYQHVYDEYFDPQIILAASLFQIAAVCIHNPVFVDSFLSGSFTGLLHNPKWETSMLVYDKKWLAIFKLSQSPNPEIAMQYSVEAFEKISKVKTTRPNYLVDMFLFIKELTKSCQCFDAILISKNFFGQVVRLLFQFKSDDLLHRAIVRFIAASFRHEKLRKLVAMIVVPPLIVAASCEGHNSLRSTSFEVIALVRLFGEKDEEFRKMMDTVDGFNEFVESELKFRKIIVETPYGEESGDPVYESFHSNKSKFILGCILTARNKE